METTLAELDLLLGLEKRQLQMSTFGVSTLFFIIHRNFSPSYSSESWKIV